MRKLFLSGCFLRLIFLLIVVPAIIIVVIRIEIPQPDDLAVLDTERTEVAPDFYTLGNNWIKKNEHGLWELYVEGKPFERGVIKGKLSKELVIRQEDAFVAQINTLIPSKFYLNFLHFFVGWFNRNLDDYIEEEYKQEIYGVSRSASDEYGWIGNKYERILNYHASHDIGHALQELHLVGCTSFSAWNSKTSDGSLLLGRNFDLYLGDEFAKDKMVCFINPEKGYKFMSVSWGGMVGAVSGMNEKGLTVTINAARSDIPTSASTPVSLLLREILQYAQNIEEAYAIAKKRDIFVSESIMIGSAQENRAVIIEKTPLKIDLCEPDGDRIICANHYQGKLLGKDPLNIENINESASLYRFERVEELLDQEDSLDPSAMAVILRDRMGHDGRNIGMGNEKAINQLLGHHSIIFKPAELKVWVSSSPWQVGEYVCYDLNRVFSEFRGLSENICIFEKELNIPPDTFLYSQEFKDYNRYRTMRENIQTLLKEENPEADSEIETQFVASNPELYYVYQLMGDYYSALGQNDKAIENYRISLTKEIPNKSEEISINEKIKEKMVGGEL